MRKIAYALIIAGVAATPSVYANETLAMQSGCLGCHKVDVKLVGPAFKDVAAKYAADAGAAERLASKVKSGSTPGEPLVWGSAMMPPSPASPEKIRGVIDWILTLK